MKKKRRPEIMTPGLKQLTPIEKKMVEREGMRVMEMWRDLYSRNRWKPESMTKPKVGNAVSRTTPTNG